MKYKAEIGSFFIITLAIVSLLVLFPLIISIIVMNTTAIIISAVFFVIMEAVLISPIFGYVKLEENALYIRYGLIFRKRIPYDKIVSLEKEHKLYSESIISLKTAIEHIKIKYNTYDNTTVSIRNMDQFIGEVNQRTTLVIEK